VGRLQLARRESVYGVDFALESVGAAESDLRSMVVLVQLLRDLSAGFDHGFLRLRCVTVQLRCVLHQFEAFRWLL